MGMSTGNPLRAPLRRMLGLDVTREVVEARLGHEMTCLGWKRPPEPRRGQFHFDANTSEQYMYTGAEWIVMAGTGYDYDHRRQATWRCAYCGTHFGEQRCPTCGAGRTEG